MRCARAGIVAIAAAGLWLAGVPAVAADGLGRLFLTPAERAALDEARARIAEPVEAPPLAESPPPEVFIDEPVAEADPIRLDGFVRRSDGPATVWVNGTDSYQGDLGTLGIDARGVGVEAPRVRLPMAASGDTVVLKPGQSYDPNDGTVSENFGRGNAP